MTVSQIVEVVKRGIHHRLADARLPRPCALDHIVTALQDRKMVMTTEGKTMHGNKKVIEQLNAALASELTAIVQYMVQSETCQNWGYVRIGDYLKRRAIEEMGHAEGLIERIVFLDATPKVDVALAPKIGANVQQQLEGDLKDEEDAVHQYNSAMNTCAEAGDNGSGDLFQRMLKDEEGHADFLDAQLHSIKEMGIGTYLAQQLHGEK